jgi:hypothetical protein
MRTAHATPPRELEIRTEFDIVAMRQEVRQAARALGLGLTQQAKISAAISTIARALIAANCHALMCMWTGMISTRPAIEITCEASTSQLSVDLAQLTQLLHFGEAQVLVDKATLSLDGDNVLCCLQMWHDH